jgi:hypothetical protein
LNENCLLTLFSFLVKYSIYVHYLFPLFVLVMVIVHLCICACINFIFLQLSDKVSSPSCVHCFTSMKSKNFTLKCVSKYLFDIFYRSLSRFVFSIYIYTHTLCPYSIQYGVTWYRIFLFSSMSLRTSKIFLFFVFNSVMHTDL